jgi:outer membrane protein
MTAPYNFARRAAFAAVLLGSVFASATTPAHAQSLEKALSDAYAGNPVLGAQRARLRAVDEAVPQALSGYRPTVTTTFDISRSGTTTKAGGAKGGSGATPKEGDVSVTQPIFNASVAPGVRRAEALVQAQRAQLLVTEQQVLLAAATAYVDVVQNEAVLALSVNNEQVLNRQLQAAQDRFRVGEYTRTDVAQSESRLAGAVANRMAAEGTLQTSKATYTRLVGSEPGKLKAPKPRFKLPTNVNGAVTLARGNNPSVLAASFSEQAARFAIDQQYGKLLPSAALAATASRTYDPGRSSGVELDWSQSASLTARVTVPIYQAGLPDSQVREAKQTANQARIEIEAARRQAIESAVSAWESLETARANIDSYRAQVRAAEIALDGVRQEAQVGSRTVLDVLNQEQELLNARVNLVRAQRNEMVAAFTLLSAVGQLTAQNLGLSTPAYDPQANYKQIRDKWIGTGVGE